MIIQMQVGIGVEDARTQAIKSIAEKQGLKTEIRATRGREASVTEVYLIDGEQVEACTIPEHVFRQMLGVERVNRVTPSRISLVVNRGTDAYRIQLGSVQIGKGLPCQLIAGPCAVDVHIDELVGRLVVEHNITKIRGGCWKPRSSPYSFPGFGKKAVSWFLKAAKQYAVEVVFIEVMDETHIGDIQEIRNVVGYDGQIVLWIGARSYNPVLLQKLGRQWEFAVMIKNPIRARSVGEWIKLAEFVLAGERHYDNQGKLIPEQSLEQGNDQIMLCSRGVEQDDVESAYRFDPRHHWIRTVHDRYWVPCGLDPSHSAGTMQNDLVLVNLKAGLLEMPDFVFLETYFDNADNRQALCDSQQAVPLARLSEVQTIIAEHNAIYYS
ncbi:MAG: hypothetical protein ABIG90_01850 [bacterium]